MDSNFIYIYLITVLKGIVHPKMKNLSSFIHPHVVSNLYELLSFAEHKILKNVGNQTVYISH